MPRETIVFYTTQTSAAGSIRRILNMINDQQPPRRQTRLLGHELFVKGTDFQFAWSDIDAEDFLIFANCPKELGPIKDLKGQRFIVNFRDPRDRICNEYMWRQSHPLRPDESEEEIAARGAKIAEIGIDTWIKGALGPAPLPPSEYFTQIFQYIDQIPAETREVLTYARLCIDFDSFIARCCDILGAELTPALRNMLEIERTEKLVDNPKWIGNQWNGSDTMPGRYKRELQPDTIAFLSRKYASILRRMALLDPDYAHLYIENVPGEHRAPVRIEQPAPSAVPKKPTPANDSWLRHIIVERPDLRIDHFRNRIKSDGVVITFSDRLSRDLRGPGFGTDFLLKQGMDVIAIKTNRDVWYENLGAEDIAHIKRWLSWASEPYSLRLGYGSGMGAFAAIRHSADLGLDRVLAVSPVFDIKNEWETRWRDDLKAMSPQKTMIAASDDLSASCDYMMVFDPAADIEHIRRFEQIIRPDRLKLLPLPQTGSDLAEPGVRDDFAVEALKTGEFPPAANVQRKRQA